MSPQCVSRFFKTDISARTPQQYLKIKKKKSSSFLSSLFHVMNDMTDEFTPQAKRDEKKPLSNAQGNNNRGQKKKTPSTSKPAPGAAISAQAGPRSPSRSSNKKVSTTDSGSESAVGKKPAEKKPEQRNKNSTGGVARSNPHRKGQSQGGRQVNSTPKEQGSKTPVPSGKDSSDALSSLQRVIADLKTTSPASQSSTPSHSATASMLGSTSNLAPNAPVFQPGAAAYSNLNTVDQKHRKASSIGTPGPGGMFVSSFSPHLGAMLEDAEDGSASIEDGEIQETLYQQSGHQPRSQSQSFMAPRFAALSVQPESGDPVGPSGRPQLAPGFMFGNRRRGGSAVPMGPPINEEDVGFQFPQQPQGFQSEVPETTFRKVDGGEITGIMAEQVPHFIHFCFAEVDG